ncbi:MAG TPA: low molecular weight phosphatase family protein [Gryllotalpicola sp.]
MSDPGGFRILAVCSGNVCRSPLAELLLRDRLAARADLIVVSAGTIARPGDRMTEEMVAVAASRGVAEASARAHGAQRLDESLVAGAGLVLGLTREHRAAAVQLHPRAVRRAFTLRELARLAQGLPAEAVATLTPAELVAGLVEQRGGAQPVAADADGIADPIGRPYEVYERVGTQIAAAVDIVARVLCATRIVPAGASPAAAANHGPDLSFSFRRA